jgi:hypothetical protein
MFLNGRNCVALSNAVAAAIGRSMPRKVCPSDVHCSALLVAFFAVFLASLMARFKSR